MALGKHQRYGTSKIKAYLCNKTEKCPHEHTLFVKHNKDNVLIISFYVDDLVYTGNNYEMS